MSEVKNNGLINTDIYESNSNLNKLTIPLEIRWEPKEDITTYELAMCMNLLLRNHSVMPFEIDRSLSYFRHFIIIDHNK